MLYGILKMSFGLTLLAKYNTFTYPDLKVTCKRKKCDVPFLLLSFGQNNTWKGFVGVFNVYFFSPPPFNINNYQILLIF